MKIHAFTTGTVRITQRWMQGEGPYPWRLLRTLTDPNLSEPLPIWCFVIEHPEGLIVVDTGIPLDANKPLWFPPHMRLAQRAAPFQIASRAEEIGEQLRANGFAPEQVRWVVLTHLHQDHEGGLQYFPNATFIVSQAEWRAASGFAGRMGGYLNQRWPRGFAPQQITFAEADPVFAGRYSVTAAKDVYLVPTPGHSAGHLSVVVEDSDSAVFFAGDASYSQALLLADALDGVAPDAKAQRDTHQRILRLATQRPVVYLPSHEWAVQQRLAQRERLVVAQKA